MDDCWIQPHPLPVPLLFSLVRVVGEDASAGRRHVRVSSSGVRGARRLHLFVACTLLVTIWQLASASCAVVVHQGPHILCCTPTTTTTCTTDTSITKSLACFHLSGSPLNYRTRHALSEPLAPSWRLSAQLHATTSPTLLTSSYPHPPNHTLTPFHPL